jgi:glycosyltransferase involved in cell wall biosynthesis
VYAYGTEEVAMQGRNAAVEPRVGVGMPVYNGSNYIRQAIESLLAQTFTDFELLICDNASTDDTEAICRKYAEQDNRIRYVRNRVNLGGGPNNTRVFELSRGEYFKIANHDDICHPEFLEQCVRVLDDRPDVVCAFPQTVDIDPSDDILRERPSRPKMCSTDVAERCWDALDFYEEPFALFGVMRSAVVRQTGLMASTPSADKVWLAELLLHGPFFEVDQPLYLHREHPLQSAHIAGVGHQSMAWWDPKMVGIFRFPYWRMFRNLARAIRRAPLSGRERRNCYLALLRWVPDNRHWLKLLYDAAIPARPLIDRMYLRRIAGETG